MSNIFGSGTSGQYPATQHIGNSSGNGYFGPTVGFNPGPVGGRPEYIAKLDYQQMLYEQMYMQRDVNTLLRFPLTFGTGLLALSIPLSLAFTVVLFVLSRAMWDYVGVVSVPFILVGLGMYLSWGYMMYYVLPMTMLIQHHRLGGVFSSHLGWAEKHAPALARVGR